MTWRFVPGDNYNLEILFGYKEFFIRDLASAMIAVHNAEQYRKYNLPNWRSELVRRELAVTEANENIRIVNEAIRLHGK